MPDPLAWFRSAPLAWNQTAVDTMDAKNQKPYTLMADGTSDASKKISVAVSPFYQNTMFPDTFTVLTIGK